MKQICRTVYGGQSVLQPASAESSFPLLVYSQINSSHASEPIKSHNNWCWLICSTQWHIINLINWMLSNWICELKKVSLGHYNSIYCGEIDFRYTLIVAQWAGHILIPTPLLFCAFCFCWCSGVFRLGFCENSVQCFEFYAFESFTEICTNRS